MKRWIRLVLGLLLISFLLHASSSDVMAGATRRVLIADPNGLKFPGEVIAVESENGVIIEFSGTHHTSEKPLFYNFGIDLGTTVNRLDWTVYSNGTVNGDSAYRSCTGYDGTGHPYPTDTHWNVESCTGSAYYNATFTNYTNELTGKYINWDWGYDSSWTRAEHNLKIQGNNDATFTYWASYNHTGEDYWLLQIDLFINGNQVW